MNDPTAHVLCPHCGWQPRFGEAICAACSALLGRRGEPIYAAGKVRRVASQIVDGGIQSIVALLIGRLVQEDLGSGILTGISIAVWFLVVLALAGRAQTPGKILLGTRIRMIDGGPASRRTVVLREFFWWQLVSLPAYLSLVFGSVESIPAEGDAPATVETSGFWWLVFGTLLLALADLFALMSSRSRLALHDRIFGTMVERVVTDRRPLHAPHMPDRDPRDPPPAPPEPPTDEPSPAVEASPPPPPRWQPSLPPEAQAALDELDRNRPHLTQSQYERRRRSILDEHGIDQR